MAKTKQTPPVTMDKSPKNPHLFLCYVFSKTPCKISSLALLKKNIPKINKTNSPNQRKHPSNLNYEL